MIATVCKMINTKLTYRAMLPILPAMLLLAAMLPIAGCSTDEVPDVTSPFVYLTDPLPGAVDVPLETSIMILFREKMKTSSIGLETISLYTSAGRYVPGTVTYDEDTRQAHFIPNVQLQGMTAYHGVVSLDVQDLAGNNMTTNFTWTFNTAAAAQTPEQPASVVIGQNSFSAALPNRGSSATLATLSAPQGSPVVYEDMLLLPDTGNNRVLAYSPVPTTGASADSSLAGSVLAMVPGSMAHDAVDDRLYLADTGNNRVVLYDPAPLQFPAIANIVLGQNSTDTNQSGCSASTLDNPAAVAAVAGIVAVADTGNNRVLIWLESPAENGAPAQRVLGQPDMDTCTASAVQDGMDSPTDVWTDGARIFVVDSGNNRVLIWNSFPMYDNTPADMALGQPDLLSFEPWVSAVDLNSPAAIHSDGSRVAVADTGNNRVLVWNSMPEDNYARADVVYGQPDFTSAADTTPSASTLSAPSGVFITNTSIIVSDTGNNRVLIYTAE